MPPLPPPLRKPDATKWGPRRKFKTQAQAQAACDAYNAALPARQALLTAREQAQAHNRNVRRRRADLILDIKAVLKKACFLRRRAPRHKKITVAVRHLEDAGH